MTIALICCAKMEENYIKEFLDHYINIGVDHIFIADNNDIDYPIQLSDYLKDYDNYISIEDYRGILRILCLSYNTIYNREKYNYDWFLFVDIDEFLTINNIKTFLNNNIFNKFNAIAIPWVIYDDNDMLEPNGKTLQLRFTRPSYNISSNFKSMYRGGLDINISLHYGHNGKDNLIYCSPLGEENPIQTIIELQGHKQVIYVGLHCDVFIKHYRFKTMYEYIMTKIKRGRPCVSEKNYWLTQKTDRQILAIFFRHNKWTAEKENFGLSLLTKLRNK